MTSPANRRPLKTRQYEWPRLLARFFVGLGVSPNQMSAASIMVALLGALAYANIAADSGDMRSILLVAAAVFIQLRLLSNLLDGLMAIEEGKKTPTGAIYNELPDRIADVLFLTAAGYAAGYPALGWFASALALLTAYIRVLGGALGYAQDFCGPMAKQQRMFALTLGSILAAFIPGLPVLGLTLLAISAGAAATALRRTCHLAANLRTNPHD